MGVFVLPLGLHSCEQRDQRKDPPHIEELLRSRLIYPHSEGRHHTHTPISQSHRRFSVVRRCIRRAGGAGQGLFEADATGDLSFDLIRVSANPRSSAAVFTKAIPTHTQTPERTGESRAKATSAVHFESRNADWILAECQGGLRSGV
jgi:hypothetical protein